MKTWWSHITTFFSTADLVEDASVVLGALYDSSGLIGIGSVMLNGVQENGVGSTSSIYPTDACLDRVYTIFGGREI